MLHVLTLLVAVVTDSCHPEKLKIGTGIFFCEKEKRKKSIPRAGRNFREFGILASGILDSP
jgi:hypothetical protein